MARKVAALYWRVMAKGLDYAEQGIKRYDEQILANKMKIFNKLAKELEIKIPVNVHVA